MFLSLALSSNQISKERRRITHAQNHETHARKIHIELSMNSRRNPKVPKVIFVKLGKENLSITKQHFLEVFFGRGVDIF